MNWISRSSVAQANFEDVEGPVGTVPDISHLLEFCK